MGFYNWDSENKRSGSDHFLGTRPGQRWLLETHKGHAESTDHHEIDLLILKNQNFNIIFRRDISVFRFGQNPSFKTFLAIPDFQAETQEKSVRWEGSHNTENLWETYSGIYWKYCNNSTSLSLGQKWPPRIAKGVTFVPNSAYWRR